MATIRTREDISHLGKFTALVMITALEHVVFVTCHVHAATDKEARGRIENCPMPFHGTLQIVAMFQGERENLVKTHGTVHLK
jgi:hypothetical protein